MRTAAIRGVIAALLVSGFIAQSSGIGAAPPKQQQSQTPPPQSAPQVGISVSVPVVDVDVIVTDNDGNFLTNLKKENFRVLEDGKPQQISNFAPTEGPITMVILMEFSKLSYEVFALTAREWAAYFVQNLKPQDWIALMDFDLKTRLDVDFTHNGGEVFDYLRTMVFPGFGEANLFDALDETLSRLQDVKGKKSILLLASGFDTFSKHNLDQTIKRLRTTDVTIFAVGTAQELAMLYPGLVRNPNGGGEITYLQAQNQLKTFASMTGGKAWFPALDGQVPGIFQEVIGSLRSQYSIGYVPQNSSLDGKYHKIKVELVAPDGGPLTVLDQKGKKVKFVVYNREGYTAPKGGVGD